MGRYGRFRVPVIGLGLRKVSNRVPHLPTTKGMASLSEHKKFTKRRHTLWGHFLKQERPLEFEVGKGNHLVGVGDGNLARAKKNVFIKPSAPARRKTQTTGAKA